MKKIIIITIILIILFIGIIFSLFVRKNTNNNRVSESSNEIIVENNSKESEKMMISDIKVIIDGMNFNAKLEDNETARAFIDILPKEFQMQELNENEKYVYLDTKLPTYTINSKHIEAGDIMLYGNNCLVVFYKSFDTNYSYTKIGHIDDMIDLGDKNIIIKFEK